MSGAKTTALVLGHDRKCDLRAVLAIGGELGVSHNALGWLRRHHRAVRDGLVQVRFVVRHARQIATETEES